MRIRFNKAFRLSQEVGSALFRPSCQSQTDEAKPLRCVSERSAVIVHVELGASDVVYIRGKGGALKENAGRRLSCLEPGTWVWSTRAHANRFEFQLLLNDEVWERGEPHVLEHGHTIHVAPDFEWPDIPKVSTLPPARLRFSPLPKVPWSG